MCSGVITALPAGGALGTGDRLSAAQNMDKRSSGGFFFFLQFSAGRGRTQYPERIFRRVFFFDKTLFRPYTDA
jgi:hypothetical protein